ncbi:Maf-like protein [Suhomyces tanzawaensis NRRL Y-17324]|uniref:Maf-like protein n=1 Tax=Suhomyces tanzawaensis NRRL Y-17324 TaxID=984487 RepID=A0A1E4SHR2_9ASCO|nr:Maf-like protein [Suhomyces tanzawaensis NRRL Y-17324]ODV79054.1 Maf-like protein [Suhomyces tanzawaensis NRRL Y-17324]
MPLQDNVHQRIESFKFILGSTSPRRLEIVQKNLGIDEVTVIPSDYPEDLSKEGISNEEYVMETCRKKGEHILNKINLEGKMLILTSDTVISCGGEIFEKPTTKERQIQMFQLYKRNPIIKAITAVNLIKVEDSVIEQYHDITTTVLHFKQSDDLINLYINSEEGLNVAGGFKYQEMGSLLFLEIHGDYFNIVGLPVHTTWALLNQAMS